jgi:hypothetical protein
LRSIRDAVDKADVAAHEMLFNKLALVPGRIVSKDGDV